MFTNSKWVVTLNSKQQFATSLTSVTLESVKGMFKFLANIYTIFELDYTPLQCDCDIANKYTVCSDKFISQQSCRPETLSNKNFILLYLLVETFQLWRLYAIFD